VTVLLWLWWLCGKIIREGNYVRKRTLQGCYHPEDRGLRREAAERSFKNPEQNQKHPKSFIAGQMCKE
jgi:hypothetical protein